MTFFCATKQPFGDGSILVMKLTKIEPSPNGCKYHEINKTIKSDGLNFLLYFDVIAG